MTKHMHYIYIYSSYHSYTEYILQNLGVVPDLKDEDVFSTSDPGYGGPELPPRYDGIILPSDWYIPGKTRRRKRQHRASHGKISFSDLSKSVSTAWRNTNNNETKLFCAQLSDIGNQSYKKIIQRRKSDASSSSETAKKLIKKASPKHNTRTSRRRRRRREMLLLIEYGGILLNNSSLFTAS